MPSPTLQPGTYPAICGGYTTEFTANGTHYTAKCSEGVRGINIRDTVTVTEEGATSNVLGPVESISALIKVPVQIGPRIRTSTRSDHGSS